MASNNLEVVLEDLSRVMQLPKLTPDHNETCLVEIDHISIQLERDNDPDYLLVGTDFGEIPLGRYREDLFEAALKTNNLSSPLYGILAFSPKNNHLVLFDRLWMQDLNGSKTEEFLKLFIKKAKIWKEAIQHNNIPVIDEIRAYSHSGIFGLRP